MEEGVPATSDVIYIKNGNYVKVMKTDYFYGIHLLKKKMEKQYITLNVTVL